MNSATIIKSIQFVVKLEILLQIVNVYLQIVDNESSGASMSDEIIDVPAW